MKIITAACELIGEHGYAGVTASALVKRAGISKGGLYHHFDRLNDVIIAAYEQTEFELFGSLALSEPASFDEYLDDVERLIFERLLASPQKLRILFELTPKIMFEPAFVAKRKIGFQNAIDIMCEKLTVAGSLANRKDEIQWLLKSISIFLWGLGPHTGTLRSDDEVRQIWGRFRRMISAQLDQSVALPAD